MKRLVTRLLVVFLLAGLAVTAAARQESRQAVPVLLALTANTLSELREWDSRLTRKLRDGDLQLRQTRTDTVLRGRRHERLAQYHRDVPVFGADVTRQLDDLQTMSIYGRLHEGIELDPTPVLTAEDVESILEAHTGTTLGPRRRPRLTVLPIDSGYVLTYQARVLSRRGLIMYFVDAKTGAIVWELNDLKTQSAIGKGRGVLGDEKKISTLRMGTTFVTNDHLRPPALLTYDMRGDVVRTEAFLNGVLDLGVNDLGSDTDNAWSDPAVIDAHVHTGWTYDYLFKRFGRRGLDNNNISIRSLVHPVRRDDILTLPIDVIGTYMLNAFYAGDGIALYGEGLPGGYVLVGGQSGNQEVNYLAGALDIVAHELTHGVTDYSSQLIYRGESGALNEAFSDIIGASVEFFFQQPGTGPFRADYLIGEDVFVPAGIRSMSNPSTYGDPDHYSRRFTGAEDNGGVHINSSIVNHAFYLAVEGGTNRTSGLSVQGVSHTNREQIEKIFYRAFVFFLPADATFSTARVATLQAARELYGPNSTAERAVRQAWDAVGVQ